MAICTQCTTLHCMVQWSAVRIPDGATTFYHWLFVSRELVFTCGRAIRSLSPHLSLHLLLPESVKIGLWLSVWACGPLSLSDLKDRQVIQKPNMKQLKFKKLGSKKWPKQVFKMQTTILHSSSHNGRLNPMHNLILPMECIFSGL